MKTIIKGIIGAIALTLALTVQMRAQSPLQITAAWVTDEGAIHLEWASQPNYVYQVQYADSLIDTNTGSITWQVLNDNYPSQGATTFWLDTGNYSVTPPIPHPKYTIARFYQIVNKGANSGESPVVAITSPATGSVLSGGIAVSVAATSSYPDVTTKLYVDGQEMSSSKDGINYYINTCEWSNGPHTIFATARALSDFPGPNGYLGILTGRGISAYVPVTFSNLINKVAFSQWFFEPSLGQTQQY